MRPPHFRAPDHPRHQFDGYGQPEDPPGLFFYDDFFGQALGRAWNTVVLGEASVELIPPAVAVGPSGGAVELALTSTSQTQDAVLDHLDVRSFDIRQALLFEARVKFTVTPASAKAVFGVASAHATSRDSIAVSAWFLLTTLAIGAETDDTDTNLDDKSSGESLTLDTYAVFQIDFSKIEDVKFLVDGKRKFPETTFDMSSLTAAQAIVQPYFAIGKSSGASRVGTMQVDYVKIWQDRG